MLFKDGGKIVVLWIIINIVVCFFDYGEVTLK